MASVLWYSVSTLWSACDMKFGSPSCFPSCIKNLPIRCSEVTPSQAKHQCFGIDVECQCLASQNHNYWPSCLLAIMPISHNTSDFKTVLQEFLPYLRHLSLSPCYAIMRWLVACSHKHYYIAVSLYLCLLYVLYLMFMSLTLSCIEHDCLPFSVIFWS